MTTPPSLDRVDVMVAAMSALIADRAAPTDDGDDVGILRVRCTAPGIVVGTAVLKEVFARMGVRVRTLVRDGDVLAVGDLVAEVGGPLAAIRAAAPTALRFLTRLSGVAAGDAAPTAGDPLEAWAAGFARLSPAAAVGDAGPSFVMEGDR